MYRTVTIGHTVHSSDTVYVCAAVMRSFNLKREKDRTCMRQSIWDARVALQSSHAVSMRPTRVPSVQIGMAAEAWCGSAQSRMKRMICVGKILSSFCVIHCFPYFAPFSFIFCMSPESSSRTCLSVIHFKSPSVPHHESQPSGACLRCLAYSDPKS